MSTFKIDSNVVSTSTISSTNIGASSSTSSPTISTWGTYYTINTQTFTVPSSGSGYINGWSRWTLSYSAITAAGTFDLTDVWVQVRLYDSTLSANVPNEIRKYSMLSGMGNTTIGATTDIVTDNMKYTFGKLGILIPGHSYTLYTEVAKVYTSGSAATLTVSTGVTGANTYGYLMS